jgi:hypothetical protein
MVPSLEESVQVHYASTQSWPTKVEVEPSRATKYEPGRTVVSTRDNYVHDDLLRRLPDLHWEPHQKVP